VRHFQHPTKVGMLSVPDGIPPRTVHFCGFREEACRPTGPEAGATEFHYYLINPDGSEAHVASGTSVVNSGGEAGFKFTFQSTLAGEELALCQTQRELWSWLHGRSRGTDKENFVQLLKPKKLLGRGVEGARGCFTGFKEQRFLNAKGVPCAHYYLVDGRGGDILAATAVGDKYAQVPAFEAPLAPLKASKASEVFEWLRLHVMSNAPTTTGPEMPADVLAAPDRIKEEPQANKKRQRAEKIESVDIIVKRQRSEIESFLRREMLAFLRDSMGDSIHETLMSCKQTIDEFNRRRDSSLFDASESDIAQVIGALRELKSIHMTIPLLESSGIAYSVKPLREHRLWAISSLASALFTEWKEQAQHAILQFTNLPPYENLVPEDRYQATTSPPPKGKSGRPTTGVGGSPTRTPSKAELLLRAGKRTLRERETISRVEQQYMKDWQMPTGVNGPQNTASASVARLGPPGKGKKRCHVCSFIIGSPTRICPKCQATQKMNTGSQRKFEGARVDGDEADSGGLVKAYSTKNRSGKAATEIVIRSPGQPKVDVTALGPDGKVRELTIIWMQQRTKLNGCKYSHIRRIVRGAVDNVLKILEGDDGPLASKIGYLDMQHIQKLLNRVNSMRKAKDKKTKGEARVFIMAAMDDIHRSMNAWQKSLEHAAKERSDDWDMPMLAEVDTPNCSEQSGLKGNVQSQMQPPKVRTSLVSTKIWSCVHAVLILLLLLW